MISVRLTAEEYDRFQELCATSGTRNVSELTRAAINAMLKQSSQVSQLTLESQVAALEGRMNALLLEFKKLRDH